MTVDKFQINSFFRFTLVVRALVPLALVAIVVWAVSSPDLGFSELGPLILLGLVGWAVWEIVKLSRWFGFAVELSDQGINISGVHLKWEDIESAHAKTAFQFDTFIELRSKDGRTFKIPACIQQNSFVLTKIEKHFSDIKKES